MPSPDPAGALPMADESQDRAVLPQMDVATGVPKLGEQFLSYLIPAERLEEKLGDMEEGFRLIEPVMYRQVILRLAAELSGTVFRVFPMGEPWLNLVARGCVVFEAIIAFDRDLAGFHVQEHLAESSAVRIFALTHCDPYTLISENTGV